ncbi:hypothetical protein OUZ56_013955 [Daphnia magna]|uniref:Uncharacterized protein n=1 Tax=Daphnia magna TaxID=35525 RepID=A0ABQ9Z7F6_9CRUS|nr:hypothetical protein OUZ56_013955 [Daphnia magna]
MILSHTWRLARGKVIIILSAAFRKISIQIAGPENKQNKSGPLNCSASKMDEDANRNESDRVNGGVRVLLFGRCGARANSSRHG